jgi:anaerobic selenocysteine-containing dehydrogenase
MAGNESIIQVVRSVSAANFGINVHLKDGKLVRTEGDPLGDDAALERLYHPDRLLYPQRRRGQRGGGEWERISWDEALDTIARTLNHIKNTDGPEFVAFGKGYRRPHSDLVTRLANAFGTPNLVGVDNVCYIPTAVGEILTFGYDGFPDFEHPTRCVLWWGRSKRPPLRRGTKLIVVNCLKTEAAAEADIWLQPRPATDLALAMGMLNVMINERAYDKSFVENWCVGFGPLKERVEQYSPEKVEEITWVRADKIREAAMLFATSRPAYIKPGNAIEDNINSVHCSRALAIMAAITGNLDIPGGVIEVQGAIQEMGKAETTLRDRISKEMTEKRIGANEGLLGPTPLWDLVAAMPLQVWPQFFVKAMLEEDPYRVKAFCVFGSNPMLTWSNAKRVCLALQKLEFLAVADFFMTPTAALADIVLPAATHLEEDAVVIPPGIAPVIQARQKVAQIGECRSIFAILNGLAQKLGLGEHFWEDIPRMLDDRLRPVGMTFEELKEKGTIPAITGYRKYEKHGFNTPSGKVELYSSLLDQWGYDPLPVYYEPPETPFSAPELVKTYPLVLTSCHEPFFVHSQDRHLSCLRQKKQQPLVTIHPETASALGIEDGEWVVIENSRGRIRQVASLTETVDPRVVSASYGWWFPEKGPSGLYGWDESNINILTEDAPPYNREMGSTNLRGMVCRVYPEKNK